MSSENGVQYDAYFGIPAIGVPGRAATELSAGIPAEPGDSADHELSASCLPGVEVRAASVRGLMHRYRKEPRQDRFSLVHDDESGRLVVSVCDGVGSLALSHEAAAFVTRHMPRAYLAHNDWAKAVVHVNERLGRHAARFADNAPPDSEPHQYGMATTFVGLVVDLAAEPRTASIAWTDDSTVWRLDEDGWTNLTDRTARGGPLHHSSVRALPHRDPRFHTIDVTIEPGTVLFVMTDGVGVPLEGADEVRATLGRWWAVPPDPFTFARQVGFARLSHMDDRTVVGMWFDRENGRRS